MAEPVFSAIQLLTFTPGQQSTFTIPNSTAWKIESGGVGGTKGAIYLLKEFNNVNKKVAILFSSIGDDDYSSPLPFWLPSGDVTFLNDSTDYASLSVTVYTV